MPPDSSLFFFFFNDTATTEIYTLSLHDALPISDLAFSAGASGLSVRATDASLLSTLDGRLVEGRDRKSTRLNSSHLGISYAVFCLKKKKKTKLYIGTNKENESLRSINTSCEHAI